MAMLAKIYLPLERTKTPCANCTRPDDWGFDTVVKKMDEREQLRQYFLTLPPEQQVDGWDKMWQKKITPWDQNRPNPALVEALEKKPYLTESPFQPDTGANGARVRKKVLVPGCGGGYDVQLFASYGFDAYGIDGAPLAIEKAEQHFREQSKEQTYKLQNIQNGRGSCHFILGNFFEDVFLSETHPGAASSPKTFDIIYDYTFLCALPAPLRPKWAARMSQLLAPKGFLITTQYPLGKDPRLGGPPFGLTQGLYEQLLNKPGREVNYDLNHRIVEDRSGDKTDDALAEIESWVPDQILEPQKGQVMVAVWKHWKS